MVAINKELTTLSMPLLNLLLNTPSDITPIGNCEMRKYLDSLAQYISEVAIDVENAAELLRERKVDFED